MGVNMKKQFVRYIALFLGLPVLFWAFGDFHENTVLKESLSVVVILSFSLMIGQFFLARSSKVFLKEVKSSKLIKLHKIIGYVFVPIIMLHPFFIVIPRYFEAGVEPADAFLTMITTLNSSGVLFGISAWVLMVVLGLTSFFRDKLGMSYKTWRIFHGILSIVFIIVACLHVLNLGSHIDVPMSLFIVITGFAGALLLLKMYIFKPKTVKSSR